MRRPHAWACSIFQPKVCHKQLRRSAPRYRRVKWLLFCSCALFMILLHSFLLPRAISYYNEPCFLDPKRLDDLRYLVTKTISAYAEHNETYWLDFGTLLGAVRDNTLIAHDGDADLSRMMYTNDTLETDFDVWLKLYFARWNISGNVMRAQYGSASVDLFRWVRDPDDAGTLRAHYPPATMHDPVNVILSRTGVQRTWPRDLVLPVSRRPFLGMDGVCLPRKPVDAVAYRYGPTWRYRLPYKWKCWMPSWVGV